jgi:hypothetical protein
MALNVQAVSPKRPVAAAVPVQRNATLDNKPAASKPAAVVPASKPGIGKSASADSSGSQCSTVCTISSAGAKAAAADSAKAKAVTTTAANGFVAGNGDVIVDIQHSDSGYQNKIYWSADNFATKHYIGVDDEVGQVNIGRFASGTKIQFGIDNGNGDFFRTGGGDANADGEVHAQTTQGSDGRLQIGFEDLRGGGDRDFNDAVISVRNQPSVTPQQSVNTGKSEKASITKAANHGAATSPTQSKTDATIKKDASKDNRSGLGDGTNPGQGSGRVNSPNTGTLNPGGSTTKTSAKPAAPVQQQLQAYLVNQQAAATKEAAAKAATPKVNQKVAGVH